MARSLARQAPAERRFAQLFSFVNDPRRFCRTRGIDYFEGGVARAHRQIVVDLRQQIQERAEGQVWMRLTSREYARSVIDRGTPLPALPSAEDLRGRKVSIWQLLSTIQAAAPQDRARMLRELDEEGWVAKGTWVQPPDPQTWDDPIPAVKKALAPIYADARPYYQHRLVLCRPDPETWESLSPDAQKALKPVYAQLKDSLSRNLAICDICHKRFIVRVGNLRTCLACRRRLSPKVRWSARQRRKSER
jgi:hypothetical protein